MDNCHEFWDADELLNSAEMEQRYKEGWFGAFCQ